MRRDVEVYRKAENRKEEANLGGNYDRMRVERLRKVVIMELKDLYGETD